MDVASSMKNENRDVTVSNIITRADNFKEKTNTVMLRLNARGVY